MMNHQELGDTCDFLLPTPMRSVAPPLQVRPALSSAVRANPSRRKATSSGRPPKDQLQASSMLTARVVGGSKS